MTVYSFIFARGGSKGLPNKNIKSLNGKPMIAYAVECALASNLIDQVFVSTDSQAIADAALKAGAQVPFLRPAELASDNAAEWLSWQHAIKFVQEKYGEFDVFVSLPATAPCRKVADVERCINEYVSGKADLVFTVTEAVHNPHFTMVRENNDGFVTLFNENKKAVHRRQDTPTAYGITPVAYVSSPEFILSHNGVWDGNVKAVEVDPISAIDIDRAEDFYLADLVLRDQQKKSN